MKLSRFILLFVATLGAVLLAASCNQKAVDNGIKPPEQVTPGTHKGPKAVYIGDSITWQWGLVNRQLKESQKVIIPTEPTPSWMKISGDDVVITWHASFFTQNNYVDKGVSGERTEGMLSRFQTDVLALDPHCVVIMGGTNDLAHNVSKSKILENLASMAEQAAAKNMKVVLCSVTPCNESYSQLSPREKGSHIIALNAMIRDYAGQKGFTYCDYWTSLVASDGVSLKDEYCLYDKLHPNPDAYTVMEGIIKPIIDSLLK